MTTLGLFVLILVFLLKNTRQRLHRPRQPPRLSVQPIFLRCGPRLLAAHPLLLVGVRKNCKNMAVLLISKCARARVGEESGGMACNPKASG